MAFRKKFEKMMHLKPDLLVLQECENEVKWAESLKTYGSHQVFWYGENQHKGVAIISFSHIQIELKANHNPEFQYIIPILLRTKTKEINLFCIWAMAHKTERMKRYVGQIWGAINFYDDMINEDSILIGDFNSNAIWDQKKRIGNHSDVVNFLNDRKVKSIYHEQYKSMHGHEKHPTLFLLKNIAKPYHIDYCFAGENLISHKTKMSVGKYEEWIKLSDHMPLIIDHIIE